MRKLIAATGLVSLAIGFALPSSASVSAADRFEFKRVMAQVPKGAGQTPTGAPLPPVKGQKGFASVDPREVRDPAMVKNLTDIALFDSSAAKGNEALFEALSTSAVTVYQYPDYDGSSRTELHFDLGLKAFSGPIRMFNARHAEPNSLEGRGEGVTRVVMQIQDGKSVVTVEVRGMENFTPTDPTVLSRLRTAIEQGAKSD